MAKKMEKEEMSEPKRGGDGDYSSRPAGGGKMSGEKSADMKGGLYGNPSEHNPLKGAVKELKAQHPHSHESRGPHHGGKAHDRHMPLHGLHPKGSHGR
jgi:hypothetical protein